MSPEHVGSHAGNGLRFAIVVARFNEVITAKLLDGARSALLLNGVAEKDIDVAWTPGSFEIPLAAQRLAKTGRYAGVICLGAVIRGDTDHYQFVASGAANGIMQAGLETNVPVLFGVLTTDNLDQALARAAITPGMRAGQSGGKAPAAPFQPRQHDLEKSVESENKGFDAAMAALEMANLLRAIGQ